MTANRICCSAINEKAQNLKVKVKAFKNSCFFCRKCGREFNLEQMVPSGVCPDLFFQIYPQYLSLLYGGKPDNGQVTLVCPGTHAKTFWSIKAKKFWFSPVINIVDKLCRFLGQPKDLFDRAVVITLLKTEGMCPRGYQGKIKFSFNQYSHLWTGRFFCPAVFYTLYPFLTARQNEENVCVQCPADYTSIIFEIKEGKAEHG